MIFQIYKECWIFINYHANNKLLILDNGLIDSLLLCVWNKSLN